MTRKQGRQHIMDIEEDVLAASSRLLELLNEHEANRNTKRIVEFCTARSLLADDLFRTLVDQIQEVHPVFT